MSRYRPNVSVEDTLLNEIDFSVTCELRTLDYDDEYEALAIKAGFTFIDIQKLKREKKPTESLLWQLGCKGYTVRHLYDKFSEMGRQREMDILESYVRRNNGSSLKPSRDKFDEDGKENDNGDKSNWRPPANLSSLLGPKQVAGSSVDMPSLESNRGIRACAGASYGAKNGAPYGDMNGAPYGDMNGARHGAMNGAAYGDMNGARHAAMNGAAYGDMNGARHGAMNGAAYGAMNGAAYGDMNGARHAAMNGAAFRDMPSMMNGAANTPSRAGSGSNFNHHLRGSMADCQRLQGAGPKHYGEKQMPGAIPPFSNQPENLSGYQSTISNNSQQPRINKPQPVESPDSNWSGSSIGLSASQGNLPCAQSREPILFQHQELCEATANFCKSNLLGEGAFGRVYRGTLRHQYVAIKRLDKTEADSETKKEQAIQELTVMGKLSNENIVVLHGYALDGAEPCLVYILCANGSLEDRLALKNGSLPLSWKRRLNILVGACKGLDFLHEKRLNEKSLIHSDIKTANILLDQNFEAKLADLGQAQYAARTSENTTSSTHMVKEGTKTYIFATKAYHAPEYLSSGQISQASDIYAMGVVFLEVCSGLPAYDPNRGTMHFIVAVFNDLEEEERETFKDKTLKNVPSDSFGELLSLAADCVHGVKKKRPKAQKLLKRIENCYTNFHGKSHDTEPNNSSASPQHSANKDSTLHQGSPCNDNTRVKAVVGAGESPHFSSRDNAAMQNSLPLRLQLYYDQRLVKNTVGDQEVPVQTSSSGEYQRVKPTSEPTVQQDDESFFPPSDPKKLQQLMGDVDVDDCNHSNVGVPGDTGSHEGEGSMFKSLPCDPRKLAHLQFDDQAYQTQAHTGRTELTCPAPFNGSHEGQGQTMTQAHTGRTELTYHGDFTGSHEGQGQTQAHTGRTELTCYAPFTRSHEGQGQTMTQPHTGRTELTYPAPFTGSHEVHGQTTTLAYTLSASMYATNPGISQLPSVENSDTGHWGSPTYALDTLGNHVLQTNIPAHAFPQTRPVSNFPQTRPVSNYPQIRPVSYFPQTRHVSNFPQTRPVSNFPQTFWPDSSQPTGMTCNTTCHMTNFETDDMSHMTNHVIKKTAFLGLDNRGDEMHNGTNHMAANLINNKTYCRIENASGNNINTMADHMIGNLSNLALDDSTSHMTGTAVGKQTDHMTTEDQQRHHMTTVNLQPNHMMDSTCYIPDLHRQQMREKFSKKSAFDDLIPQ